MLATPDIGERIGASTPRTPRLLGWQRCVTLDAACAAYAYSCIGRRDFLRMVLALVRAKATLLVDDAGARHALIASSLRVDQPIAPPTRRRWLIVSDSPPPGRHKRQRLSKPIVVAQQIEITALSLHKAAKLRYLHLILYAPQLAPARHIPNWRYICYSVLIFRGCGIWSAIRKSAWQ